MDEGDGRSVEAFLTRHCVWRPGRVRWFASTFACDEQSGEETIGTLHASRGSIDSVLGDVIRGGGLRNALLIERDFSTVPVDEEDSTYDPYISSSFISVTHFTESMRSSVPFNQNPDEVLESLYMCRHALVI